jgi:hypothetical protein
MYGLRQNTKKRSISKNYMRKNENKSQVFRSLPRLPTWVGSFSHNTGYCCLTVLIERLHSSNVQNLCAFFLYCLSSFTLNHSQAIPPKSTTIDNH